MVTTDKIESILRKGIIDFSKHYEVPKEQVQLSFYLNENEKVVYLTCVLGKPKHTVQLHNLIGRNLYNFAVDAHIKKLLQRFEKKDGATNLFVSLHAKDEIKIWIRDRQTLIRQLTADELK